MDSAERAAICSEHNTDKIYRASGTCEASFGVIPLRSSKVDTNATAPGKTAFQGADAPEEVCFHEYVHMDTEFD